MAPEYTTIAKLKNDIPLTTSDFDDVLLEIIEGVSSQFDAVYGETFESESVVELHDGRNTQDGLILFRRPGAAPTLVEEDGTPLTEGDDYQIDSPISRRLLRMDGSSNLTGFGFAVGTRNVSVTYPTEFILLPASIDRACIEESIRVWLGINAANTNDGGAIGITSRSPETGTTLSFTAEDLMPKTIRLLESFHNRRGF